MLSGPTTRIRRESKKEKEKIEFTDIAPGAEGGEETRRVSVSGWLIIAWMGLYSRSYYVYGGRKHDREQCGRAVKYRRRKIFIIRAGYSPAGEFARLSASIFRYRVIISVERTGSYSPASTSSAAAADDGIFRRRRGSRPMRNFYRESAINLCGRRAKGWKNEVGRR